MAAEPSGPLSTGEPAPDSALASRPGEMFSSAGLRGHPAILAFYPADWPFGSKSAEVSRRFGAYRYGDGFSERALFVLDADGVIRWQETVAPEVNPGAAGILSALDDLRATSRL
jgi:peroxiredoxin